MKTMNMDKSEVAKQLRDRIHREDDLINKRTNIFLVLNGLGSVAAGLGSAANSRYLVVLLSVILNSLWLIMSIQCLTINFRLTKALIDIGIHDDIPEQIVQKTLGKNFLFRPNAILNIYIPFFILTAWIVGVWHTI